jgi:hypothetical protein
METPAIDIRVLVSRVIELERQNRHWKVGDLMIVVLLMLLLAANVRPRRAVIRLERPLRPKPSN